jgi:hypothetical protein
VLLNSATGFTTPATSYSATTGFDASYFALGDISGDGRLDVVISYQDGTIGLLVVPRQII